MNYVPDLLRAAAADLPGHPDPMGAVAAVLTARRRRRQRLAAAGAALAVVPLAVLSFDLSDGRDRQAAGAPTGSVSASALTVEREPCPTGSSAAVDFIGFVQVGQRSFTRGGTWGHTAPAGIALGRTVETVRCTYGDDSAPAAGYRTQPGDASYLPVGTKVREVIGFEGFRVAAETNGTIGLYELEAPPTARTGADVFPGVRPHVVALALSSQTDGKKHLSRISAPERVAALADQLFAAPHNPQDWQRISSSWDVFLDLVLDDGTRVQRAYDSQQGVLHPGLRLPSAFRAEVRRALG